MTTSDWIAAGGLTVTGGGIGIRMIMKMTRLTDAIGNLDKTITAAITDHEHRLHESHCGHPHRRAG